MTRKFDIKIDTVFDKGDSEIFQFKFSSSSFIAICEFFCQIIYAYNFGNC